MWTSLSGVGGGLYSFRGIRYPGIVDRPDSADILYYYNRAGMMDSLVYPAIQTGIHYAYNRRKWIDSITARQDLPGLPASPVFKQVLTYDPAGQILTQRWQHGNGAAKYHEYKYDAVQRLTDWSDGALSTNYQYDAIGNRMRAVHNGFYYDTQWDYVPGTNGLMNRVAYDQNSGARSAYYDYNSNGSVRQREHWLFPNGNGEPQKAEQFAYGYRELPHRMQTYGRIPGSWELDLVPKEDWRYRYNAAGEREQKRMYKSEQGGVVPAPEEGKIYPWIYYMLGGRREQLAVYHGQQRSNPFCGDTGMRVYLYPVEYLSHGVAYTGVREDISQVITLPTGRKQYRIHDHMASLRATIDSGAVAGYDYDPWGGVLEAPSPGSRRSYNDREEDAESGDYNLGVRQYGAEDGKFHAVDPLWEKFPGQSPYVYSYNNPLRFTDPKGEQAFGLEVPFYLVATAASLWHNEGIAERQTGSMASGPITQIEVRGYGNVQYGSAPAMPGQGEAAARTRHKDIVNQLTDGPLDAFRHAYASALTAQQHGAFNTIAIGELYEKFTSDTPEAAKMDRVNNVVGALIGARNQKATRAEIYDLVYKAMLNGELILYKPDPK